MKSWLRPWQQATVEIAAVDCITLNYWGKHNKKMAIRGIKLTGKQPAAIQLLDEFILQIPGCTIII